MQWSYACSNPQLAKLLFHRTSIEQNTLETKQLYVLGDPLIAVPSEVIGQQG